MCKVVICEKIEMKTIAKNGTLRLEETWDVCAMRMISKSSGDDMMLQLQGEQTGAEDISAMMNTCKLIFYWSLIIMSSKEAVTIETLAPRGWNPKAKVICLVLFGEEEGHGRCLCQERDIECEE